jgi:hypothetical protein
MSSDATSTTLCEKQWAHKARVHGSRRCLNLHQNRLRNTHCCDQYSSSTSAQLALLNNSALCCASVRNGANYAL